jgi:hypothetical protein
MKTAQTLQGFYRWVKTWVKSESVGENVGENSATLRHRTLKAERV